MAVARCTARRYRGLAERDELESAAMLALVYAASTYDPTHPRGATFITYLIFCCRRRCWRSIQETKKVTENERPTPNLYALDPRDEIAQVDDRDYIEHLERGNGRSRDTEVAKLRLEGYTFEEIGRRMGVTKERSRQLLTRFRNELLGVA